MNIVMSVWDLIIIAVFVVLGGVGLAVAIYERLH